MSSKIDFPAADRRQREKRTIAEDLAPSLRRFFVASAVRNFPHFPHPFPRLLKQV